MSELRIEHLSHRFGGADVLRDVSLTVLDGEFLVLVGPSGCGKSTLLRVVAGLIEASAGQVSLGGARIDGLEPRARDVAMVFQNYALYPHMSVRDNLAFPLKLRGLSRDVIDTKVRETAELLSLFELLERKPASLSGGQMQRVALGRAIIRNPRLFLFDEPLSNLDARMRLELRGEIMRLHERLRITSLYVTHDQAEAMTMGSRIAVMHRGVLEQVGPPLELYREPRTRFVAGFLGTPPMNFLAGRVRGGVFELGALRVECPSIGDGEVELGVRPHELALASDADRSRDRTAGFLEATASRVEQLGRETLVEFELAGQSLCAALDGSREVRSGEKLAFHLPPQALHWFERTSGRRLSADAVP